MRSFAKHPAHREVVYGILQESKWFIEWTAAELDIQAAAELVNLQIQMALWGLQSANQWQDENWRLALAVESERWSNRVLELSGLLNSQRD